MNRIEIWPKDGFGDPHADGVFTHIRELGIDTVSAVDSARLFFLAGDITDEQVATLAGELLVDKVTERVVLGTTADDGKNVIETHMQVGVMDPTAASILSAAKEMGIELRTVQTGRRYELGGDVTEEQKVTISTKLLANAVIEDYYLDAHTPDEHPGTPYQLDLKIVSLLELDEAGLMKLSEEGHMFLNITEMKAIQDYYRAKGREPRDVELEMLAQTWSEHCGHKTFRSDVKVMNAKGEVVEEIPNLLKNTVFKATMDLNKPWCLNVFADNAGVIEFDEENAICFKVETHNHPSAIEPYGGSMTGIGGVVRDPMGTGLGSRPIANTDVFCFGDTTMDLADVPAGVLHPRRTMRGVVAGVRDYGNRMGIPTVNGAVYFDDRYIGNPLVFCGTVAIMPREAAFKQHPNHGDTIVVVGGRTGRDGIHGATFSSGEMTHETESEFSHAVQIGNAITEKKILDTLLQARDKKLYTCITDCGAGGLSSAVGEMGEEIGAKVQLEDIPIKYAGLSYDEIWISEAQERMVLAVSPDKVDELLALFASEDVEATDIGTFGLTDDNDKGLLELYYGETLVGELDMEFLHDGTPRPTKDALWDFVPAATPAPATKDSYNDELLAVLASPNVASKEWVIRQYDHEVQGTSAIKPLVGVGEDGPGDAAVVTPIYGSNKAVAISCGMNPTLGDLDPYQSALHAVDEALRNLVSVGGDVETTAILDNFCWGNCNKPDRMGALVQAAKACYEAAMTYGTPFVSGKDSLNNEFVTDTGETIAIPPTLLISAFGLVDDASKCITSDAKAAGNKVYLVGTTRPELGGAHLLLANGLDTGNDVPPVDCKTNFNTFVALGKAIRSGLARTCHDLSEGGLAAAAAEMAFSGGLGIELSTDAMIVDGDASQTAKLFGESAGRFLVEVTPDNAAAFEAAMGETACAAIGEITDTGRVQIDSAIDLANTDTKAAWQGTFNW
ncbi:MAG: phosphoribosylformylglycinamidine synthase subunit PurL [Phycisphaerales bacterium]|jgi:phosphoribosylformylglycinamidine synthase II|nr:phosphoribosylformylglycinamidine synthase subunit PurL [Phycisphaerales bacterium]MBT7171487.1 phosphoribosylformylglycinamidine synthase subunit PurL [Phycisphaerales bacterium]